MLSDISQTQKDKYCMILLYELSRITKSMETESRLEVRKGWEQEDMESLCLIGTVSVWGDEKFYKWGKSYTTL